jgi:hypothetical protein
MLTVILKKITYGQQREDGRINLVFVFLTTNNSVIKAANHLSHFKKGWRLDDSTFFSKDGRYLMSVIRRFKPSGGVNY